MYWVLPSQSEDLQIRGPEVARLYTRARLDTCLQKQEIRDHTQIAAIMPVEPAQTFQLVIYNTPYE